MSPEDPTRRDFLAISGAQLAGLSSLVAAGSVVQASGLADTKILVEGIRSRLQATDPQAVIEAFRNAPSGTLMLYYQLFFPMFITGDAGGVVRALARACDTRLKDGTGGLERWHRVRALPAVAAAHAMARIGEEYELKKLIVATSRRALDPSAEPHREVLEIVWQNMTSALMRNERHWLHFSAGPELVQEAEEVCKRFISSDPTLLHAGATSYQFLATYANALRERSRKSAGEAWSVELSRVEASLNRLRDSGPLYGWLRPLEQACLKSANFETALPQVSEALMGRARYPGAADLLVLMRLQMAYYNDRVAEGVISTPYMRDKPRSLAVRRSSLAFLRNYGITQADWPRLQAYARVQGLPIPPEASLWFDDVFAAYERHFDESELEREERTVSPWLGRCVPFRDLDEETAIAFGRPGVTAHVLPDLLLRAGTGLAGLLSLWRPAALYALGTWARQRNLPSSDVVLFERVEEELSSHARNYEPAFDELRDAARHLSTTHITVPTGLGLAGAARTQPPGMEDAMDTGAGPAPERQPLTKDEVVRRGMAWYETVRPQLERDAWLKHIVINVETGEVITGDSALDVSDKFAARFPGVSGWITRVGDPTRV